MVYSKSAGSGAWETPLKEVVLDPQSDNIYLKPTAVLVSGDTVSAAEIFTIAMASIPQVAIIGERTAGAFSDVLVKRLASDILFGISNETYLDTQGNNYEGVGIATDIAVPFGTLLEREGGYDAGIDAAIGWIKNAP
jgi:C-terminal processing protease CtpA/Prc